MQHFKQIITSLLPSKAALINKLGVSCAVLAILSLWLIAANAGTDHFGQPGVNFKPVAEGDTTYLNAQICENTFLVFEGDTLREAGIYTRVLTGADGQDSTLVLDLGVSPLAYSTDSIAICAGDSVVFNGQVLTETGTYEATLSAANGCDSIATLHLTLVDQYLVQLSAQVCANTFYVFHGDTLTQSGIYTDTLTAVGLCDSIVVLDLKVLPVAATNLSATICTGNSYIFQGDTLSAAGTYRDTLIAVNGCDSVLVLQLDVVDYFEVNFEASICFGETYVFGGDTLGSSGIYIDSLLSAGGCDSLLVLQLSVLPQITETLEASICTGDIYLFEGDTLRESGIYAYQYTGVNGCDSTVTLTLEVLPLLESSIEASVCAGDLYVFNGDSLDLPGVYTATYTGGNGCDSTVTLNLTFLPKISTNQNATTCANEPYLFGGLSLNASGVYEFNFTASNGCDSTLVLTLEVLPVAETALLYSICTGDTLWYNGNALTENGVYNYTFDGVNGCDSLVSVRLDVFPSAATFIELTLCDGESYVFFGDTINAAGTYDTLLNTVAGCDSTVTLVLNYVPAYSSTLDAVVCAGETFILGNDTLGASGVYTKVFTAVGGCDSTIVLNLTVLPALETQESATICNGETYPYNGQILSTSGTYSFLQTASNGCDSTIVLSLTVLPAIETPVSATICNGETYPFNGQILSTSGTYNFLQTASNGCDSTIVLNLTVLPALETEENVTICNGETYSFNGGILSTSGTYSFLQTASNGCDSTIVLNLTVLPEQVLTINESICAGDSYLFNGAALTQAGQYSAVLENSNGCDSLVVLNLSVAPLAQGMVAAYSCDGAPYLYNGLTLTTSGTYTFDFPGAGANGCDSLVTLVLTIFPAVPPTAINASICAGESYVFNGETLTMPGLYTAVLSSVNSCDSTVQLTFVVNTPTVSVALDNNTLVATAAANSSYQWIDCQNNQPISGATGSSFTPASSGSYAVIVTQDACVITSTCTQVTIVGTKHLVSQENWKLQPNPASDFVDIQLSELPVDATLRIELYEQNGRLLQALPLNSSNVRIPLDALPEGVLLVRLVGENVVSVKRLVITR